jgi:NTE family protein
MKFLFFTSIIFITLNSNAQTKKMGIYRAPQNRVLVVSGGGARGAWGVGVCKALLEQHSGYKAVYGTSTGSLMAPMILLQKIEKLEYNYTHVTQGNIFNLNPFKIKKEPLIVDGQFIYDSLMTAIEGTPFQVFNMSTDIKPFNAFWRLLWGKATVGKSENLLKLIHDQFTENEYDTLRQICINNGYEIGVGVTNMKTGKFEMIKNTDRDYQSFTNYMWASSNQPVWMSYYYDDQKKSFYVDGGLLEVLPIRDAIEYAKKNSIDTIDVVLNNSITTVDPNDFNLDKSFLTGGLLRILATYGQATLSNNIELGRLQANIDSCEKTGIVNNFNRSIQINIYSMNKKLASLYKDELGFDKDMMRMILTYGYVSTKKIFNNSASQINNVLPLNIYPTDLRQVKMNR